MIRRALLALALAASLAYAADAGAVAGSVAAGAFHACALDGGAVSCWGRNNHGQTTVPATVDGAGEATSIAARGGTSCAIRSTGALVCWGWNGGGIATPPSAVNGTTGTATKVSIGNATACAIQATTNAVVCWGENGAGEATPPDSVNGTSGTATAIAVGLLGACAIQTSSSAVICWGRSPAVPPAWAESSGWNRTASALAMGDAHGLALASGSLVAFWGIDRSVPFHRVPPEAARVWSAIAAERRNVCGISAGAVSCFRLWPWTGALVPPSTVNGTSGTASSVTVGRDFACAIRSGALGLVCWGENGDGQATPPGGL